MSRDMLSGRFVALSALLPALHAAATDPLPLLRVAGSSTVFPIVKAWESSYPHYNYSIAGGGSSHGARSLCGGGVDVGGMSRDWKAEEVDMLDDGYTVQCKIGVVGLRATQLVAGVDGLAVVVGAGTAAHGCLTNPGVGGLTLAQLRWIFSGLDDARLASEGLHMASVAPHDDADGIKEWSDLFNECEHVPINPYGAGDQSGTHDFFAEVVLDKSMFKDGLEDFRHCNSDDIRTLEHADAHTTHELVTRNRSANCYMPSEDDEHILEWVLADRGGIAYFGYAYYAANSASLTTVRIASDRVNGVQATSDALINPSPYSIVDGSYSVFRRMLFLNVNNEAWPLVKPFLDYGFSSAGQALVSSVGYVRPNAALHAKMLQRIAEGGNELADLVPVQPEKCAMGLRLATTPYLDQWGRQKIRYECLPCHPGTFKDDDLPRECRPCQAGKFAEAAGMTECGLCAKGHFSPKNSVTCQACAENTAAADTGTAICVTCDLGHFTEGEGAAACEYCPRGKFRDVLGPGPCLICPTGMTTDFRAATESMDCRCAEGSYHMEGGRESGPCLECPAGMRCAFGSEADGIARWEAAGQPDANQAKHPFPMAIRGFMTLAENPMRVYKCKVEQHCPGGVPGTCAHLRRTTAVACGECAKGAYEYDGTCEPCGATDVLPFILAGVGAAVGVVVMTVAINRDVMMQTRASVSILILLALTFNCAQTLNVFESLSMAWVEPITSIMAAVTLLSFDIQVLRLGCLPLSSHPAVTFALRQCIAPLGVPFVLFTLAIKKYRKPETIIAVDLMNTIGTLYQIFFMAIIVSAVGPFVCYSHPDGVAQSMVDMPAILCFNSALHSSMAAIGIVSLLIVPLPFLAMSTFAIYKYPVFVANNVARDAWFRLQSFRYMFFRFAPTRYYYAVVLLFRGLVLCMIPVVVRRDAGLQIFCTSTLITAFSFIPMVLLPWRVYALNIIDAGLGAVMSTVLLLGAMAQHATISEGTVRGLCLAATIGAFLFVVASLCIMLYIKLRPTPHYDYFVCHHKADAAAQSRYLKLVIQSKQPACRVFIDSDDLTDLDVLFDIVRCKLSTLLVYLTQATLTRPWCAGEICIAHTSGRVEVVPIRTSSFVPPTEEQLDNLRAYVCIEGWSLSSYGIELSGVALAFRSLCEGEADMVRMSSESPLRAEIKRVVAQILARKTGRRSPFAVVDASSARPGCIIVSVDPLDSEACAAGEIISMLMLGKVMGFMSEGIFITTHERGDLAQADRTVGQATSSARAVVVVCSARTLACEVQLAMIVSAVGAAAAVRGPAVIPVNLPSFAFPSDEFYRHAMLRSVFRDHHEDAIRSIRLFFFRISVYFPIHAAEKVLVAQCDSMLDRVPRESMTQRDPGLDRVPCGESNAPAWDGSDSMEEEAFTL